MTIYFGVTFLRSTIFFYKKMSADFYESLEKRKNLPGRLNEKEHGDFRRFWDRLKNVIFGFLGIEKYIRIFVSSSRIRVFKGSLSIYILERSKRLKGYCQSYWLTNNLERSERLNESLSFYILERGERLRENYKRISSFENVN